MIRIIKQEQCSYSIDLSVLISSVILLLILFANLTPCSFQISYDIQASAKPVELSIKDTPVKNSHILRELYIEMHSSTYEPGAAHLEEIPDMSATFYATVPIGRYYITAYNHEETGGKTTASGTTCHQGTVTTCAADVWGGYFKFGDYIEVDGRLYRVEDTGSAVKKKHIDLYFASYKDMVKYGSNYQTIYRVEFPFGKPKDN